MKWIKKLLTVLIFSILITVLDIGRLSGTYEAKAVTFDDINNPQVFLKQKTGDSQCTLVAVTMMLRRAAMLSGNKDWADITVDKVMEQAWVQGVGMKYTFTYAGITVNKATFGTDPVNESEALLGIHPEGIVLYDQIRSSGAHAVLLTDYTDGAFYSVDPAEAAPTGRILNSTASVQVKDGEYYWYVSSPQISPALPSATEANVQIPTDISTCTAVLSQTNFFYDGTEKKPAVTVSGLTENADYVVSYLNNVNSGSASVIITGIGEYSGTLTKSFTITDTAIVDALNMIKINPAKQTIKKDKTAVIKATLPASLELVKEYSGIQQNIYKEVKLSYASSNKKAATINSSGKITGKAKGTANIYVTASFADGIQKTFTLKITVK